jgi:hypothetical protein
MSKVLSRVRKTIPLLLMLFALALPTSALAGGLVGDAFPISADKSLNETEAAIAYNPDREEYLVVWYNDSQDDFIQAQRLDKDGSKIGSPVTISEGLEHDRHYPDVAYNTQHDQYLVVWEDRDKNDWKSIQARRLSGTGSVLDSYDILISEYDLDIDSSKPAVGYSPISDTYMVVWTEYQIAPLSYGVYARRITYEGNYKGSPFTISQSIYRHSEPDIAYNSQTDRYLVVWQQLIQPKNVTDIRGCQVYGDGGIYSTVFDIHADPKNASRPAVATIANAPGDNKFLVVFEYEFDKASDDYDIWGYFIENNGAIGDSVFPATSFNKESTPAVAWSESAGEFLVTWREDVAIHDNRLKACLYDINGVSVGFIYETSGEATAFPAVDAGPLGDFLVAWQDQEWGEPDRDLFGALFGYRNYAPLIVN